jgi:hypothetical protein
VRRCLPARGSRTRPGPAVAEQPDDGGRRNPACKRPQGEAEDQCAQRISQVKDPLITSACPRACSTRIAVLSWQPPQPRMPRPHWYPRAHLARRDPRSLARSGGSADSQSQMTWRMVLTRPGILAGDAGSPRVQEAMPQVAGQETGRDFLRSPCDQRDLEHHVEAPAASFRTPGPQPSKPGQVLVLDRGVTRAERGAEPVRFQRLPRPPSRRRTAMVAVTSGSRHQPGRGDRPKRSGRAQRRVAGWPRAARPRSCLARRRLMVAPMDRSGAKTHSPGNARAGRG